MTKLKTKTMTKENSKKLEVKNIDFCFYRNIIIIILPDFMTSNIIIIILLDLMTK